MPWPVHPGQLIPCSYLQVTVSRRPPLSDRACPYTGCNALRLPIRLALCLFIALFVCASSRAQGERILDFHSDISLQPDTSLLVTETIVVIANGKQIRHGIYRDFPTRYQDFLGNKYVVGFHVLGATRDSVKEPFRVQNNSNGERIYLGDSNATVPLGRRTYTLTYTTNRQLGFFPDHDELFWNVTGLGWGFLIDHASASVHLLPIFP